MSNEIIFCLLLIFVFLTTLFAFRLGRRYLFGLIMLEVGLMNIFVVKQFDLFGLAITGGNVLYGGIFLATDILNEFYGKRIATCAVWAGFGAGVFMLVTSTLVTALSPNEFDSAQAAFKTIFSPTFRIVFASLASCLIFQSLDVWLYDLLKKATNGKALWLRNNLSTIISQTGDSIFFTAVGLLAIPAFADSRLFAGFIPAEAFWEVVAFTLIIKITIAILDTPIIYLARKVKHEGLGITERLHKFLD
ncbi:queuosine precursor transporter [Candidatus Gracilibacteria bacterium]|nr:queuosine precursor transporter [Candidatus Gracilibacteria bacterium]MCF7856204.1 queuosine precursor transporter [Candidatus Gracilibacteria bacterium]MCF7896476.1 queuosine precursor transporter [Candidatus Gracilibacteria bacterium]